MVIRQIQVKNFRLLKNFVIDLQQELSLVVGKNNVGKTSLLIVLDKFLNYSKERTNKFQYNDFNLDFQKELEDILEQPLLDEISYEPKSISLRLVAEFFDTDNLDNIGNKILTNLEDDNNFFAIGFDYQLDFDNYIRLIEDFKEAKTKFEEKQKDKELKRQFDKHDYMESNYYRFFRTIRKSVHVEKETMLLDESHYIKLDGLQGFRLDDVINFEYISARRNVDNKDVDHTLSVQTSELYKAQEDTEENIEARENFIASLKETDNTLTDIYGNIFDGIIKKIGLFGGMHQQETIIKVISTLQHRELLSGNTTVVYEHDNRKLPENFNGLGYMNLISMIFEISLIVERMKRSQNRRPADINILFIEEPEAHTHPQMQYVFIKNIKNILRDGIVRKDGIKAQLQSIVSTHSSHIVSDSDFDDIKYLKRVEGENAVESKNMHDLKSLYISKDEERNEKDYEKAAYRFLRQYLTLMNSELFFADKAVFVEGDTERILLPLMMKKVDNTDVPDYANGQIGLLSQNISVLPIGAHSHIFEKFFHFIGLTKLLILTDLVISSSEGHHKKCPYEEGQNFVTSNAALKHYFNDDEITNFINKSSTQKKLKWNELENKMSPNTAGNVMVCYQTKEGEYQPRSFEDDFFHLNAEFITESNIDESALNKVAFSAFKKDKNPYKLAEEGIISKATLAISLMLAESNGKEWKVPTYIKEGLLWLRN